MLLPQTEVFNLLRNRLQCVPNYWGQPATLNSKSSNESQSKINFGELFAHFKRVQELHHRQRVEQRKKMG